MKPSRLPAVLCALCVAIPPVASAQPTPGTPAPVASPVPADTARIAGTVRGTTSGIPIANATVRLEGPTRAVSATDVHGAFSFRVSSGLYTVTVSKAGFQTAREESIAVAGADTATVTVNLAVASFSSLRTIGEVTVRAGAPGQLNTSTASVNIVSRETFLNQGQVQVTKVLNETPGTFTTPHLAQPGFFTYGANGAVQSAPQIPQIRGALPYETQSLIDGHPVSVGAYGFFSPIFINPALLQNVEVVMGPGAMPAEINNAIGGSVNYRTLEPTRIAQQSIDAGVDNYGGTFGAFRATGSTSRNFLNYAVGYATNGTPGPVNDQYYPHGLTPFNLGNPPYLVNGLQLFSAPQGFAPSNYPQYAGVAGAAALTDPVYIKPDSSTPLNTSYFSKSELAKIRLNFSQQSSLTMSYLGGQSTNDFTGIYSFNTNSILPFETFQPPPGYIGSVPAGTSLGLANNSNQPVLEAQQQNLFQGEFRTTVGEKNQVLARFYSGHAVDNQYQNMPNASYQFGGATWGGLQVCPAGTSVAPDFSTCLTSGGASVAPVTQFYNGQHVTFSEGSAPFVTLTHDNFRGYSAQLTHFAGDNVFAVSFDRSVQASWNQQTFAGFPVASSSSQQFSTILARANLQLTSTLRAELANYFVSYQSHFSGNGGVSFQDSSHASYAPRAALSWRPNHDVSYRLSLGASIAPPFIALLDSPGTRPTVVPTFGTPQFAKQNANNGQVAPETAFGYDLGVDKRLSSSVVISADVYLTNLRDLFLPSTFQNGTYVVPSGPNKGVIVPLYVTQTGNLGHARYQGLDFSVIRSVPLGVGYRFQGSLERAYVYNLPPHFYAAGTGEYATNLGIIPNVNFQPSGYGYNALEAGRVPYAMGYAEVNYQTRRGVYGNLGITYYGSNNTYNRPAFGVLSASLRVPLAGNTTVQLSGDNLTNVYSSPYFDYFGGNSVTLANAGHATRRYIGLTPGENLGPATFRLLIRHAFGSTPSGP